MKKILLATTVLAGSAGFAFAEVTVSGYAEMGILGFDNGIESVTTFHQDVEVKFTMSGETDGGLSFGAVIDLDETDVEALDDSDTTVFVSGAFGKVTMGDTDGALDWAVQDAGSLTSMGDDHTTHVAYFSANGLDEAGDGQVVRYEYAAGDFGLAVSAEQIDNGFAGGGTVLGVGANYSADMGGNTVKVGLGYQTEDVLDTDAIGLSVGVEAANGFSGMIGFQRFSSVLGDVDHTGLGVTYKTGALSLHANYGELDAGALGSADSFGLAANYDLGGGAVVMAGYGSDVDALTAGDQNQYSIGLGLSF